MLVGINLSVLRKVRKRGIRFDIHEMISYINLIKHLLPKSFVFSHVKVLFFVSILFVTLRGQSLHIAYLHKFLVPFLLVTLQERCHARVSAHVCTLYKILSNA